MESLVLLILLSERCNFKIRIVKFLIPNYHGIIHSLLESLHIFFFFRSLLCSMTKQPTTTNKRFFFIQLIEYSRHKKYSESQQVEVFSLQVSYFFSCMLAFYALNWMDGGRCTSVCGGGGIANEL